MRHKAIGSKTCVTNFRPTFLPENCSAKFHSPPRNFFQSHKNRHETKTVPSILFGQGLSRLYSETKFQMISPPCHRPVTMTRILGTGTLYPTYLVLAPVQDKIKRYISLIPILSAHCKKIEPIGYSPG